MSTITVGPGQKYTRIAAAVAAAQSGDVINVQAGTYTNDFISNPGKNLTLQAVGGPVKLVATVSPTDGKAIITEGFSGATMTINGFDISGAKVADGNGAAIRYEGGKLILNNVYIHNNQDGILGASSLTGTITINNSEFAFNGAGDGRTHNLYVNDIATLSINGSYFHDAKVGHEIKSRAENTVITNSRIFDNNGTASYSIDLPNGGNATIQNNVIEQGPNSENPFIIAYGEEGNLHAGTAVKISQNIIVNDKPGATAILNRAPYALPFVSNSLWGLTSTSLVNGSLAPSGTNYLVSRPTLDTSSIPIGSGGTSGDTITISATQTSVVINYSNVTILATAGNHVVLIGGTHDTAILTGGFETVTALLGYNNIKLSEYGDTITIGGTNNVIDGGGGADTVKFSSTAAAVIVDLSKGTATGQGNDTLFNVENVVGSSLGDTITGSAGNNRLDGSGGVDILQGLGGNDVYVVDNAADIVKEVSGAGNDTVLTSVSYKLGAGQSIEALRTTNNAGTGAINLTGNELSQAIVGNAGPNFINGAAGNDTLTGMGGADTFGFSTPLSATGNVDRITDFAPTADKIQLAKVIFSALAVGALPATAFFAGTAAHDADDRIIYNATSGALTYDSNGNAAGGATQFATLNPGLAVVAGDFTVV